MAPRVKALMLVGALIAAVLALWPIAVGAASPTFETHISLPPAQIGSAGSYSPVSQDPAHPSADEIFVNGAAYPSGTTWRLDYNGNAGVNSTVCIRLFDVTANSAVAGSEQCLTGAPYTTSSVTTLPYNPSSTSSTSSTIPPGNGSVGSGSSFSLAQGQDAYLVQEYQRAAQPPAGGGIFTTVQLVGTATASSPPILGEIRWPSMMGLSALLVIGLGAFFGSRKTARTAARESSQEPR